MKDDITGVQHEKLKLSSEIENLKQEIVELKQVKSKM